MGKTYTERKVPETHLAMLRALRKHGQQPINRSVAVILRDRGVLSLVRDQTNPYGKDIYALTKIERFLAEHARYPKDGEV